MTLSIYKYYCWIVGRAGLAESETTENLLGEML
jgi:hypothetical protein